MIGPDGPEERTAALEEYFYDELERCEIEEKLADEAVDESLLDIAEARMTNFWLERVIR